MEARILKKAKRQVERMKIFVFSSVAFFIVSVIILPLDYFIDSKMSWSLFPVIIWFGIQLAQFIEIKFNYFWEEKEINKIWK